MEVSRENFFPLLLKVEGKVLVAGGGKVATEKVCRLLQLGIHPEVVAKEASSKLEELAKLGEVSLKKRAVCPEDFEGVSLAVLCLGEKEEKKVARWAREKNCLVVASSTPQEGNCFMPAVVKRGNLLISISTKGEAPALARFVREFLEEVLPEEVEKILTEFVSFRKLLPREERRGKLIELWQRFLSSLD